MVDKINKDETERTINNLGQKVAWYPKVQEFDIDFLEIAIEVKKVQYLCGKIVLIYCVSTNIL